VSARLVPREAAAAGIAGRLLDLADRVRRLPPPDRRDPERFHIERDHLAAELRHAAAELEP
jgi:hypothetical protein